jgi:hypothetical protein
MTIERSISRFSPIASHMERLLMELRQLADAADELHGATSDRLALALADELWMLYTRTKGQLHGDSTGDAPLPVAERKWSN